MHLSQAPGGESAILQEFHHENQASSVFYVDLFFNFQTLLVSSFLSLIFFMCLLMQRAVTGSSALPPNLACRGGY